MKKAIVTGCTGAVGVALIEELIKEGWQVIAVPRVNSKRRSSIPNNENVYIIPCDLEYIEYLASKVVEQCDVFYHLAWDGTYGSDRLDCERQNKNVAYTLKAVRVAKKLGCKKFIGVGSQSECGYQSGVLNADVICRPDTPYGASKLSACYMSRILCEQLGMEQIWCRILSIYGPHDGSYTMMMSVIRSFLRGESPACTEGKQVWDYMYSKDAAKALRLVGECGRKGTVYYLASGKSRLLKDYIIAVRDEIDRNLTIGFGERPYFPNQVMRLEADISDLQRDTGFELDYTFEEGIKETIQWVKEMETDEKGQHNDSMFQ